jgi:thymidylate synthase
MKSYLDIIKKIIETGVQQPNRTGIDAITVPGIMFEHDMSEGFPLLTTKFVPFRLVSTELEFFLRGYTDKEWLRKRNNHIWDEWCRPDYVSYAHNLEIKNRMKEERDLGPIYGWQWRNFGAVYRTYDDYPYERGIDQLKNLVDTLQNNPNDRRMIVIAWNPLDLKKMALPPCHYAFQVTVINNKLNLLWNQRSVDTVLGLPFNIASYALLLHLLARHVGLEEGRLVGFLADTHIYISHLLGLKEQLKRNPLSLSKIITSGSKDIFTWSSDNSHIEEYQHHDKISFEIAV